MIEEQRLGDRLQHVHRVVVPADVRELVGENRFDLRRRQRRERGDRQQDRRPQPADDRRHVDERRLDDVRGRRQAEAVREPAAGGLPARRRGRQRGAMQPAHVPPAAGHPREQHDDAGQPRDGDAGQRADRAVAGLKPRQRTRAGTATRPCIDVERSDCVEPSAAARCARSGWRRDAVEVGARRHRIGRAPEQARRHDRRREHRASRRSAMT